MTPEFHESFEDPMQQRRQEIGRSRTFRAMIIGTRVAAAIFYFSPFGLFLLLRPSEFIEWILTTMAVFVGLTLTTPISLIMILISLHIAEDFNGDKH